MNRLLDVRQTPVPRIVWTIVLGFLLGGLMTFLSEAFIPESPARDFLVTSVAASVGPVELDLVAVAVTLGPLDLRLNVLTLAGIGAVALVARSWM